MYFKQQKPSSKSAFDSSNTNAFSPQPFKVESVHDDGAIQRDAESEKRSYESNIPHFSILRTDGEQPEAATSKLQTKREPNYQTLPLQPKLTIGEPGDRYEQEADRMAKDVVQRINSTDNPTIQQKEQPQESNSSVDNSWIPHLRIFPPGNEPSRTPMLQPKLSIRQPGEQGGDYRTWENYRTPFQPKLQRATDKDITALPDVESGIQRARGGGQPLAESIREPMEQAFEADFSRVRVHADSQADQLSQSIQAKAFTTGQDVFFRQGMYQPTSRGGQELLAHELTHVVQQSGGAVQRKDDDTSHQVADVNPVNTSGIPTISNSSTPIQRTTIFIQRVWYEKVGEDIVERQGKKPGGYRAVKVDGKFLKHKGETVYETQEQRQTHVEKPKTYAEKLGAIPEKDSEAEFTVDAELVRFSQNSIAKTFAAGGSIYDTVESLKSKKLSASDFPPIRVFMGTEDRLVTLDNRRLWCCKEAGVAVKCRWASDGEIEKEGFKFTSGKGMAGRTTIDVRG